MEQREIKFRVWHKNVKLWMSEYCVYLSADGKNLFDGASSNKHENPVNKHFAAGKVILQQFTGLKDKNGKEIYEGDILEINYSAGHERDSSYDIQGNFLVMFKNGEWKAVGHNLWGNEDDEYSVWGKTNDYAKKRNVTVEIVGNIFENPELLN